MEEGEVVVGFAVAAGGDAAFGLQPVAVLEVAGVVPRTVQQAGFRQEARLPGRLRAGSVGNGGSGGAGRVDLLVYGYNLPRRLRAMHPLETYYGARRPFQAQGGTAP